MILLKYRGNQTWIRIKMAYIIHRLEPYNYAKFNEDPMDDNQFVNNKI